MRVVQPKVAVRGVPGDLDVPGQYLNVGLGGVPQHGLPVLTGPAVQQRNVAAGDPRLGHQLRGRVPQVAVAEPVVRQQQLRVPPGERDRYGDVVRRRGRVDRVDRDRGVRGGRVLRTGHHDLRRRDDVLAAGPNHRRGSIDARCGE